MCKSIGVMVMIINIKIIVLKKCVDDNISNTTKIIYKIIY